MRRRDFIGLAGAATVWPRLARAQQPTKKIPVVMRRAFHDLSYVEGESIMLEHRFPA